MKSAFGTSRKTDVDAAVSEATANIKEAKAILFFADYDRLEGVGKLLKKNYPQAQIIGTAGIAHYNSMIAENGLLIVTAIMSGAEVSAGVIQNLSTSPLTDIGKLEASVKKVSPGKSDTVCIEFCTNDEEVLVSTMNVVLDRKGISLAGGTVFGTPEGKDSLVCCNGEVYKDACAYMVIKNQGGKAYVVRENIYDRADGPAHIATKVNLKKKELIELDHRPAAEVYSAETGVPKNGIVDNVLKQPLGRVIDEDVYISSMNGVDAGGAITNYKQINENDAIFILKLLDYRSINKQTKSVIEGYISKPSLIFSVNCIYRYLLFSQEGYLDEFLRLLSGIGPVVGYIGGGEQFNRQHVNQTMVCAIFE